MEDDKKERNDETEDENVESETVLDYDEVLKEIGEFGFFQKVSCFLLWFPAAAGGIHVLMYAFTGLEPENFRCIIPGCNSSLYDGFISVHGDNRKHCSYYEAEADESGHCKRFKLCSF